jgi:glycerophosphoryl diester phosphodiesterase
MRRWQKVGVVAGVWVASVYLLNASWLAEAPPGRPTLIAQRGVHQVFDPRHVDNNTCTASRIPPPAHALIDNTLPSIAAAFNAGADVVEVDLRQTSDGQYVLFHDASLDCRTDGHGLVVMHALEELRQLDVGYGYTADGGRSFPLRGKGVGQMPTLEQALRAFPARRFLVQLKDGGPDVGDKLVRYLEARELADWLRLSFFGNQAAIRRLSELRPQARTWYERKMFSCAVGYLAVGWSGYVPEPCSKGVIIVPTNFRRLEWGWPNRFLQRMRRNDVQVLMIGSLASLHAADFTRLDSVDELHELPAHFDGAIWTDHIERIGPAARGIWR